MTWCQDSRTFKENNVSRKVRVAFPQEVQDAVEDIEVIVSAPNATSIVIPPPRVHREKGAMIMKLEHMNQEQVSVHVRVNAPTHHPHPVFVVVDAKPDRPELSGAGMTNTWIVVGEVIDVSVGVVE